MKNSNQQKGAPDFATAIIDLFHLLCVAIWKPILEMLVNLFKCLFEVEKALKKIEREDLGNPYRTKSEEAIGVDAASGNEIKLADISFARHSFIVGASGFGKTNLISILQEHSLSQNRPIIFFDPKGDLEALTTFKGICQKYKRTCYIFSEHYHNSIALNPFLEGTINQVVDRIMCSFEWSEPFYQDASRRSLTKALKNLKQQDQPFTLERILSELVQMETKDNVGLISKLEAIQVSDFGRILNSAGEGLTLSKIRQERACLYIGLSTQGYGETAKAIGKLFLGELLYNSYTTLSSEATEDTGLKNPISVYFDEFGALVTPGFIELQNKCRGAGIELTVAVQTPADIDQVSPDLRNQIIENAANLFVLKQRVQDAATIFSEAIGTGKSKKQTYQIDGGEQSDKGTEREVHELLVHPDIIKNLRIGQCVLLRQGPTRLNLINIRNREEGGHTPKITIEKDKTQEASKIGGPLG